VQVSIGENKGTRSVLLNSDAVSIKKSMNGLQRFRADRLLEKAEERFEL
jgi:hypothetical protein